jgi:hypothetical protein
MSRIIIGGGPAGLRAAAAAQDATLLDPTDALGGLTHPELPEDRGLAEPAGRSVIAAAYGEAPEIPQERLTRALRCNGVTVPLPMRRRSLQALLPKEALVPAVVEMARVRARARMHDLLGGGQERRTAAHWGEHLFGRVLYDHVYNSYIRQRYGDPEELNVSIVRHHHGVPAPESWVGLGRSPAEGVAALRRKIPTVHQGARLQAIEVRGGKVDAVRTDEGRLPLDGALWYAGPLEALGPLLGDALPPGPRWQLQRLRGRHRVSVALRRIGAGEELHIADPAPFFRLSRPELLFDDVALSGIVVADLSLPADDPRATRSDAELAAMVAEAARGLGLPELDPSGARVRRLRHYDPEWVGPWHPNHLALALALSAIGVHLVGRLATHRFVDAGQELQYISALMEHPNELRELSRTLLDPPVTLNDQDVSLTRFVER